jgi:hypothetical protein
LAVLIAGLLLVGVQLVAFDVGGVTHKYQAESTHHHAPEVPEVAVITVTVAPSAPIGVWDRLARCESGGDWTSVSRSGVYRGGLQFDQPTWRSYGGTAYASSAHLASRTQQIAVAERLRSARGFQPWPVCRRVVGL